MTSAPPIPVAPGAWPLLGHSGQLARSPLPFLESLRDCGDLAEIRLFTKPALLVCDGELTRQVLLADRSFDKGGPFYDSARDVVGNGLITRRHVEHRPRRQLLQPAFDKQRLAEYSAIISEEVASLLESWQPATTVDVVPTMLRLNVRIATRALLGYDLPDDVVEECADKVGTLMSGIYRQMLLKTAGVAFLLGHRHRLAQRSLRTTLNRIVAHQRNSVAGNAFFLDTLTAEHTSHALSDDEISDEIISFFLAGAEPGASTVAWALHLIACHPEVRIALQSEVDDACGEVATYGDLPRLEYTKMVVTETLRLYPPSALLTRTTTTDTDLGPYRIRKGTVLVISPYLVHRDRANYASPGLFTPERWSTTTKTERDRFLPFGGGARKCLGYHLAMIEAVLTLASITARWEMASADRTPVKPLTSAVLSPKRLRMSLQARR